MVCQLDSLRKCLKLDALRKALNTLPKTLDDTYERILFNLDQEYKEDALKLFQWLCFSERPMRLDKMVEVLAIDSNSDSRFSPEQRLPDPYDILTICSTLVSVTAGTERETSTETAKTQILRLAHFSVKEYLISDRLKNASMHCYHITPLSANVSIAKACLTYLLYFENPIISRTEFDHEFPFGIYAARFWSRHYRSITNDANREAIDFLAFNLVESEKSCFINWLSINYPWGLSDQGETQKILSPLYCMSLLGISGVCKMLLNKGVDVNEEGGLWGNALSAASLKGHEEIVRLLLEKGANVNAKGGYHGNALSAASFNGNVRVVQFLLEKGANVNAEGGIYGSALSAASYSDHKAVVELLLEKGSNVNAEGGDFGNALSAASQRGHEKIVRLLLEKGANVNAKGGYYGNALSAASGNKYDEIVRLLLEKGENFNPEDRAYDNALQAASFNGHDWVVRQLLEKGANVNVEAGNYGNSLSAASVHEHNESVR